MKTHPSTIKLAANFTDDAAFGAIATVRDLPRWSGNAFSEALGPLLELPNWVTWRWVRNAKTGKWTKVPFQPNGAKAKSNDPGTWTALGAALKAVNRFDGVGFCLFNTEIAAFDLDDCRDPDTGMISPWARELVARVGSYTEVTISGTGLRIIGLANGERTSRKQPVEDGGSLETYRRNERYIVMTGDVLPETSEELVNIDAHIDAIVAELDAKKRIRKNNDKSAVSTNAQNASDGDDLWDLVRNGCGDNYGGDRSRAVWAVINGLLRCGYRKEAIEKMLLDETNGISAHIYDQKNPSSYTTRQIEKASREIDFIRNDKKFVLPIQENIRVALLKLNVEVRYNRFSDQILINGLKDFGPVLEDAAMDRMWLEIDRRFHFRPNSGFFYTVVSDSARLNSFNPVIDYLDRVQWDGHPRIGKWLSTYGGAMSSPYVDAVGSLMLIAAVRRIRRPGCKFDEIVVLESPQGTNKSTALKILAVDDTWFSDDLPLNADGKRAIESLRGRWIIEAAELSGMKRADIEPLKAFLSRQVDRARMAYGRLVTEVRRQCIIFGTTNDNSYLRDTTGNRRIWPIRITQFDLEALTRDRDQLWAEASVREAQGESIRLDRQLWAQAAAEQSARMTEDPFFEALEAELGNVEGKITTEVVWSILGVPSHLRGQEQAHRVTSAMNRLGWERPKNRIIKVGAKAVAGFVKGPQPWALVDPWNQNRHMPQQKEPGPLLALTENKPLAPLPKSIAGKRGKPSKRRS
ncbi:MAG: hypothetical protein J0H89_04250 [Rhizobiales bacterium]|nr:hypothetical protein [Hyphomicrobiales bacterium]